MKKQNLIIILVLLLIVVSAYFGIYKNKDTELGEFDLQFQDTSKITAFSIESKSVKVLVEKKENGWTVNKSYHANSQIIKRLFRIYNNLNISIIGRKDSTKTYIQKLKNSGTKLQFLKNEKVLATYWVGNYYPAKRSTLLMNDKELPAFVTAPGLSSDIAKFVVADDIFWRDKRIFDFEPEEITKIELKDFQNLNFSFELNIEGENYQLKNTNENIVDHDKDKIARYMSYFKGIRFESLTENFTFEQIDSIIGQKPQYEISLSIKEYGNLNLKLIAKADSVNKNKQDLNYVYGIINNKTPLLVISYFAIDPLLKEIDYFSSKSN